MNLTKQLNLDVKLDGSIRLENFIVCPSTELILKVSEEFILRSEETKTLFLWGKKGVGKNYLLQGINQRFVEKNVNSLFISFKNNKYEDPKIFDGLEELEVIFVESLEDFPFSEDWEVSLFNLINACFATNCQLLISANMPVKDLPINLPDLKSRLLAFPAFELPEINEEEKLTAMRESAERKGWVLEDKVLSYILTHASRNLSDLLKLLNDLDNFSLEKKRKVTTTLVRELIFNQEDNQDT
tara:strand:+ start:41 stop:766 length:726 start_codon:yes stop_codon:yes gene_type:complete